MNGPRSLPAADEHAKYPYRWLTKEEETVKTRASKDKIAISNTQDPPEKHGTAKKLMGISGKNCSREVQRPQDQVHGQSHRMLGL